MIHYHELVYKIFIIAYKFNLFIILIELFIYYQIYQE
jgi:hypothetical protein